jgi:uncharacterized membrane protein YkoI
MGIRKNLKTGTWIYDFSWKDENGNKKRTQKVLPKELITKEEAANFVLKNNSLFNEQPNKVKSINLYHLNVIRRQG